MIKNKKEIKLRKFSKLALLMALVLAFSFTPVYASNIDDAKGDKEEAEKKKEDAEKVQKQLEEKRDALIADVKDLDSQITSIQGQITEKQAEADTLQTEIADTKIKLAEAQKEEDNQYANMTTRIQYLYENGDLNYMDTIMSSSSFTDMLNQAEYIESISNYDQGQLDQLIATKNDIANYESTLESDLKEVEEVQQDLEAQNTKLAGVISTKNDEIDKFGADIDAQESLVKKFAEEEATAEKLIAKYEAQSVSNAQSSGQVVYNTSNFSGKLQWPAVAGTRISSGFGNRKSPTAGASQNHKGIDIPAPVGSNIVAAESGTVVISRYSSSAGNYVMIDHGNGMSTVYMHNSQLCVSVGQKVSRGQVIAKAGSTGYSTGSHCHFGVMINGTYVNPLNYLGY